MFLVSLYTLFFGGMYLADWRNVYIPEPVRNEPKSRWPDFMVNISNRLQYAGQFWIGIAAWPAIWQYNHLPVPSMETSPFWHRFQKAPPEQADGSPEWDGISLNQLQRDSDKTWDLAWVYTVIAGVLNILVIYDAFAGPAFVTAEGKAGARLERVPA